MWDLCGREVVFLPFVSLGFFPVKLDCGSGMRGLLASSLSNLR